MYTELQKKRPQCMYPFCFGSVSACSSLVVVIFIFMLFSHYKHNSASISPKLYRCENAYFSDGIKLKLTTPILMHNYQFHGMFSRQQTVHRRNEKI